MSQPIMNIIDSSPLIGRPNNYCLAKKICKTLTSKADIHLLIKTISADTPTLLCCTNIYNLATTPTTSDLQQVGGFLRVCWFTITI
jgi:hypothetical protein